MLVVVIFLGYKSVKLINRSDPDLARKYFVIDLSKDNKEHKVGEFGFDLAFGIRARD